ncbi:hypothetical protein HXX76_015312 [Chlamydomonas incerta]|uniref:Uncharacterized protein n=1 Tax=Chlamydomonas incerta TaxID=51695 RepID=A0A835SP36_CHLIN|nr:hypothetical protein HXX76_015312 [Chlamydomonas incerta]|eukprot:KAG2423441.1 hypothetical protein HXX76_015312 [Chlamydomonas incerta]
MYCPGSIYTKSELCLAKRRDECGKGADRSQPDSDGCVVSDWGAYLGKSQYEQYGPASNYVGGDANNVTDFYRARGNCSYAQNAVARLAYSANCAKQNQLYPDVTQQINSLNTSSVQAMNCAATGCATTPYNGTRTAARFAAQNIQGIAPVYTACEADTAIMWSTRLNPKTDGLLYRQYQLCYSSIRQRNKALCQGAVLA